MLMYSILRSSYPMKCRRMDSPLEYGYGNRHTVTIRAMNTITMIAVPQRTNES